MGAAFTYLTLNPGDEMMEENLAFYTKQPSYKKEWLIDLEEASYKSLYFDGTKAYEEEVLCSLQNYTRISDDVPKLSLNQQDWETTTKRLSEAVSSYLEFYEDRRIWCEDVTPQHTEYPIEFYQALGDAAAAYINCTVNIEKEMERVRGGRIKNLLPSSFHYLQFAFYKDDQVSAACEAVGTYLLFFPEDETMLKNKKFYQEKYKLADVFFTPDKVNLSKT